ncbi:hypothetical protein E1165_16520 [Micromonospora sp. KC723]|nr:hypothetical protein E1165_16520 [Micromonospora sp. KC723]
MCTDTTRPGRQTSTPPSRSVSSYPRARSGRPSPAPNAKASPVPGARAWSGLDELVFAILACESEPVDPRL